MRVTYASTKVEKYFSDFNKLKKELPPEWVRTIKKHLDRLEAANCFGDFLRLGLGKPEQLRISANARLIIEPNATQDTIMICDEIEIEGVSDYHGGKENWYIP